jgi:hypothetical protein
MGRDNIIPAEHGLNPFAFEQITVDNTAGGKALTAATMNPDGYRDRPCKLGWITTEDQGLRYTVDGTAPTAAIGHEVAAANGFWVAGEEELKNFRAIRTGGSSAIISVTYYR